VASQVLRALVKSANLRRIYLCRLPYLRWYAAVLSHLRFLLQHGWGWLKSVTVYDQIIRYDCDKVGNRITFFGTYPLIENRGYIELGDNVIFVGRNNLIVGFGVVGVERAKLVIGSNVTIGYQCEINVGCRVTIGNNVRIATGVKIFDNNSHPVDAMRRREKLPMTVDDVGPVVIEDDAWIATNAMILKNLHIGKGAVVAAGAVVTHDVPSHAIVAGNPARVVKRVDIQHLKEISGQE
jgi:acetyltransferase-like isoleucine patch superfamily enzyme